MHIYIANILSYIYTIIPILGHQHLIYEYYRTMSIDGTKSSATQNSQQERCTYFFFRSVKERLSV